MVKFKKNDLPKLHIVDRYFEAVKPIGVVNPGIKGDFYIHKNNQVTLSTISEHLKSQEYVVMAIGAQFSTKRLPISKCVELLSKIQSPVVIIGGEMDVEFANEIVEQSKGTVINSCGKFNIQQSASVVEQSKCLITNDTGMMHIGACFSVSIVSIWGSTIPDFGMYPYRPNQEDTYSMHEVLDLSCRPCSKLGHQDCPKGHFKCMMNQDTERIAAEI